MLLHLGYFIDQQWKKCQYGNVFTVANIPILRKQSFLNLENVKSFRKEKREQQVFQTTQKWMQVRLTGTI